jgi:2-methylcitrate dehydratase
MRRNMIKFYPAQINTQSAIEAVLCLYRTGIRAGAVRKLILYGNRNCCAGVQGSAPAFTPATREAADHSTPYVMAMALLRGRLTSREYDGAPWETAEVKNTMAKIQLVNDPERTEALDKQGSLGVRLVAELTDGRVQEIITGQPKGHPEAPLTDAELLEKMTWLLERRRDGAEPAEKLLNLCRRLSTADDVKDLIEMCGIEPS